MLSCLFGGFYCFSIFSVFVLYFFGVYFSLVGSVFFCGSEALPT